jgi:hypothetical protein
VHCCRLFWKQVILYKISSKPITRSIVLLGRFTEEAVDIKSCIKHGTNGQKNRSHAFVVIELEKMEFVFEFLGIDALAAVRKRSTKLGKFVGHLDHTWHLDWACPVGIVVRQVPHQSFHRNIL